MSTIIAVGTGCIIGNPILVGFKAGKIEIEGLKSNNGLEETFVLLERLGVSKEEKIKIPNGNIFNKFCNKAQQLGYKNIERTTIDNEIQEKAENIFLSSLYKLGLSDEVVLKNKNYSELHEGICSQLILNPELLKYVKPHYKLNKNYTKIFYKVERMNNEFPNLLGMLR